MLAKIPVDLQGIATGSLAKEWPAGALRRWGRRPLAEARLNLRKDFEIGGQCASEETPAEPAYPVTQSGGLPSVVHLGLGSSPVKALVSAPSVGGAAETTSWAALKGTKALDASHLLAVGARESSVDKAPSEPSTMVEDSPLSSARRPRWADVVDEDFLDVDLRVEAELAGEAGQPTCSKGSAGHPFHCADPCKYAWKPRGCKDGAACPRCHLCTYTRSLRKKVS